MQVDTFSGILNGIFKTDKLWYLKSLEGIKISRVEDAVA